MKIKKSKIWIGEFYPENQHYQSEANQTIGQAGITDNTIMNRRNVTNQLTEDGNLFIEKVKQFFKSVYDLDVKLTFSKYCGCSTCPCSPGFKIYAIINKIDNKKIKSEENCRFKIFYDNKNKRLDIQQPKDYYLLDNLLDNLDVVDNEKNQTN